MARTTCSMLALAPAFAAAALAGAQTISAEDAATIAGNWARLCIDLNGHWAGSTSAAVVSVQELHEAGRRVGYFCDLAPRGFVVVPLRAELAPVKAYSRSHDLDPLAVDGPAALIRESMLRTTTEIESRLGPLDEVPSEELLAALELSGTQLSARLLADNATFQGWLDGGDPRDDYTASQVLVDSDWHQNPPYNDQCPDMGCSWPSCYYNDSALVGCVATAGAQIMRHWHWPPYGVGSPYNDTYDWVNMPIRVPLEPPQCNPPLAQVNAVAELCAEIGQAVGMNYGCGGSGAPTSEMEAVYENQYRYAGLCNRQDRDDYGSAAQWLHRIKASLNANQPIQYRIPGHSIVCDGWEELWESGEWHPYYHMNYGWGGTGYDIWYHVDELFGGSPGDEYILENIYPVVAISRSFTGYYPTTGFPYRYVSEDADGSAATFQGGQYIQFLRTVVLRGVSSSPVRIEGITDVTHLFVNGDTSRGALLDGGVIRLTNGGGVCLAPLSRPIFADAVAAGPHHVDIGWEAGLGTPDAFEIQRQIGTVGSFSTLVIVEETHYSDLAVTPGEWHGYRVRAITHDGGASDYTDEIWVYVLNS